MQELENLFNSLIKRGWKPWGIKRFVEVLVSWTTVTFFTEKSVASHTSLRSIVSLESGLWQFCIEQKLCRDVEQSRAIHSAQSFATGPSYSSIRDHQYRLLESALIPEEELAKFLIDNIIITWSSK